MDKFLISSSRKKDENLTNTSKKQAPEVQAKGATKKKSSTKPLKKKIPKVKVELPKLQKPSEKFEYTKDSATHTDNPPFKNQISLPKGKPGILTGIQFAASGTLPHFTRAQIKELLIECGARLVGGVNQKTDVFIRGCILVSKDKEDAAKNVNAKIIDEAGLIKLINDLSSNGTEEEPLQDEPPKQEEVPNYIDEDEEVIPKPVTSNRIGIEFHAKTVLSQPHDMLTEKYRPKVLSEVVGNSKNIEIITKWITNFDKEEKKAILISGPPGIGKTTTAMIIAKKAGFHVIEYNASDVRNKAAVDDIAKTLFDSNSLYMYHNGNMRVRSAIIFDEIDGMSTGDRGGISALASFIDKSNCPIICICNEKSNDKMKPLFKHVKEITFSKPDIPDVANRIYEITKLEGIKMNRENLRSIVNKCNGDLRSALNQLQLWKENVGMSSEKSVSQEQDSMDPFEACKLLYKEKDFEKKINYFMVDYNDAPVFTHDILRFNGNRDDYADAMDAISIGNIMDNCVKQDATYDLLIPLGVTSCIYPASVCRCRNQSSIPRFPSVWGYMSRQNKNSRMLSEFAFRSARVCSQTTSTLMEGTADVLAYKMSDMMAEERTKELVGLLNELEITKDDCFNLRDIVSFGPSTLPEATTKVKAALTREFDSAHQSQDRYSSQSDERAAYFISGGTKPKGKGGRKKK